MSDMNSNEIAFVATNMVQFHSIKKGMKALEDEGIGSDLYVPLSNVSQQALLDETYRELSDQGYLPLRTVDKSKKYKIWLEPSPMDYFFAYSRDNYEFRIRYRYSSISAKPDPIYSVDRNIVYDAILCHAKREAEILSAYTKTFCIPPMKFANFQKDTNRVSNKPVLLYLPTFGDVSSIDNIEKAMKGLKEKYYIIAKAHHGTQYFAHEKHRESRKDILEEISDECLGQKTDIVELLKKADIVLSDNSGSIFDAIYAEVPVAVFNEGTLNKRKLGNIDTYQYQLVERGIVPFANDIKDIEGMLETVDEYREKQRSEKNNQFGCEVGTAGFVEAIKEFLVKDRNQDEYYAMRDIILETYFNLRRRALFYRNKYTWGLYMKAHRFFKKLSSAFRG